MTFKGRKTSFGVLLTYIIMNEGIIKRKSYALTISFCVEYRQTM